MFNSTSAPALNGLIGIMSTKAVDAYLHNGPVCSICHRGYVGTHTCSSADLQRLIDGLQVYLDQARRAGR